MLLARPADLRVYKQLLDEEARLGFDAACQHERKRSQLEGFTLRELEVAQLMAEGNGNKQIARLLDIGIALDARDQHGMTALHLAADDVLDGQTEKLAIQRRIATDMRDIWAMQPRFERRVGKSPYKLLEHPRMRAGYDFLLLRCQSGELDED